MISLTGEQLARWLGRLVQIPSVNPAHEGPRAGKVGELALATAVSDWFRQFGGEVELEEVLPGRPNVYGIWRGSSDRWAAIDVHIDTVGVEQMTDPPFDGRVENGRVYGRGAVDTKASLAVALAFVEAIHTQGITPEANILLGVTVDEESEASGAVALDAWIRRKGLQIDELMVCEPTFCGPVYGHKGFSGFRFTVQGKTAHSSQPHFGVNAITGAAHVVLAIEAEHQRLLAIPAETELGTATITAVIINGGNGMNIVPDSCTVSVSRRNIPGEDPTQITSDLKERIEQACPFPVEMEAPLGVAAYYQPADSRWIQQLAEWSGIAPTVVPYGTNALMYQPNLAKEIVVLGPGSIDQAHGEMEWVEIAELEKLADIYGRWWGV
ncbi:MAG: M20 family metallopeptidase [Chloroflexota bacterium]